MIQVLVYFLVSIKRLNHITFIRNRDKKLQIELVLPLDETFKAFLPDAGPELIKSPVSKYRERYALPRYAENTL